MTREEAIEILRAESGDVSCNTVGVARWMEAIDMAISALRQQEHDRNEPLTFALFAEEAVISSAETKKASYLAVNANALKR